MSKMNQRGYFEPMYLVYGFIGLIVLAVVVGLIWAGIYRSTNKHEVTFTVNKTERVQDRDGQGSQYMVYTDNGVYKNVDSLLNNKFNSADLYNQLQPNHKYKCVAVGFRNGVISEFENLISCEEVK